MPIDPAEVIAGLEAKGLDRNEIIDTFIAIPEADRPAAFEKAATDLGLINTELTLEERASVTPNAKFIPDPLSQDAAVAQANEEIDTTGLSPQAATISKLGRVAELSDEGGSANIQTIAAAVRVADKAAFGIGQELFAGFEAAKTTVGDALVKGVASLLGNTPQGVSEKSGTELFNESYTKIMAGFDTLDAVSFDKNPVVQGLADGIGYVINTAATGGIAKYGIKQVVKEVTRIEGTEAAFNTLARTAGGEDIKQVAKEEGMEFASELGGGVVGYGIVRGATGGISRLLKDRIAKRAAKVAANLDESHQVLAKDYEGRAYRFRTPAQAQEFIKDTAPLMHDYYTQVRTTATHELADAGDAASGPVREYINGVQKSIAVHADDMVRAIHDTAPKDVAANLKSLSGELDGFKQQAIDNFGIELNEISDIVAKNHKAQYATDKGFYNTSDIINKFYTNLVGEGGEDIVTQLGKVEFSPYAKRVNPDAVKYITDIGKRKLDTFKDVARLNQEIGKMVNWKNHEELTGADAALRDLWVDLAELLGDEKLLGEQAERYLAIKGGYKEVLQLSSKVSSAAKSLFEKSNLDSDVFLTRINATVKTLENVQGFSNRLASSNNPLVRFSPEKQALMRNVLGETRKLAQISKVTQGQNVEKALIKMAKSGEEITDANARQIKELLDELPGLENIRNGVRELGHAKVIEDALLDPLSKTKVQKARRYVELYAGDNKEALTRTLGRMAKIHRKAGLDKVVEVDNVLNLMQKSQLAHPVEIQSMRIATKLDSSIASILTDVKFAQAIIKHNPSVFTDIISKGSGSNRVAAAAVGYYNIPLAITLGATQMIWNTMKSPTALLLMLERANLGHRVSKNTAFRMAKIANFAAKAAQIGGVQTGEQVNEQQRQPQQ